MTVHVRVLNGPFFDVEIQGVTTVGNLRWLMEEKTGTSMAACRITYQGGVQLDDDDRLLVTYGITEGSTVVAVCS